MHAAMQAHHKAAGLDAMTLETHDGVAVHRIGRGPALVLLHGGRGSWNHWIRNLAPLSRHFSLYAVDLPGFGASLRVARHLPYDEYVALLAGAVRRMTHVQPFLMAGFSFGGLTAAMLAAHHLGAQVQRLSLLAPAGWGNDAANGRENRRALRADATAAERRAVFRHNLAANQIADPAKITEDTVDLLEYNIARTVFSSPRAGSLPLLLDALRQVRCPLQVLMGSGDVLQQPSVEWRLAQIRAAAPQVLTALLEGAGHWAQYEMPDEYNARLLAFMQADAGPG
ncbi:MAG: alpha/beta fold hydrolase [Betaproteobacteria bacterium]|nr:alpha/beta fold hydrolase [Betaproteobacteria bacterium]